MSFNLGNIVNSIANSVMPGVTGGGDYVATDPPLTHEPAHAQLAGTPANPAAGSAERQGIIIIGGHPAVDLHPSVAAAAGTLVHESTHKADASQSAPRLLTDLLTRLGSMAHELHKSIAGNLRA